MSDTPCHKLAKRSHQKGENKLRAELSKAWSDIESLPVVELASRNRSVADYCSHWEGRALTAEGLVALLETQLAESRANDHTAMSYLAEVRDLVGGKDFPDMVARLATLIELRDEMLNALETVNRYLQACIEDNEDAWIIREAMHKQVPTIINQVTGENP